MDFDEQRSSVKLISKELFRLKIDLWDEKSNTSSPIADAFTFRHFLLENVFSVIAFLYCQPSYVAFCQ